MSKIFLISDIHFGLQNKTSIYAMQKNYFYNFLLPMTSTNDYLFILGDVFENRTMIDIKILHDVYFEIFSVLSKSFKEIHILVGNHDMYNKNTNDITLLDFLIFDNVHIHKEEFLKEVQNQKYLFVPFYHDKNLEKEILKRNKDKDYICLMHTEISGFYYTKNIIVDDKLGNNKSFYSGYKQIYSGHFHIRQNSDNITYIGSPYHLNRNDIGNKKGVHILYELDGELVEQFIENDYSPEFLVYNYDEVLELYNKNLIEKIFKNNYIDLYINEQERIELNKIIELDSYPNIIIKEPSIIQNSYVAYDVIDKSKFSLIEQYINYMNYKHDNIDDLKQHIDYITDKFKNIKN